MEADKVRTLPDGFVPVQATYGDETTTTDVTPSVLAKLAGQDIEVTASDKLIPALSFADAVELTEQEKSELKAQAVNECGNASDQNCLATMEDKLRQAKLQDKSNDQQQAGGIKGERLTVVATNSKGQQRTFYVPKGFTLLGGSAVASYNAKRATTAGAKKLWDGIGPTVINALKIGAYVFFYALSVLTTWRNLTEEGYMALRWAATATAVVYPMSGFIIQIVLFAGVRFVSEFMEMIERRRG